MKDLTKRSTEDLKPITSIQLQNLENDVRKIINDYMIENGISKHRFSKSAKIHPNQLYLFLNGDRGLNITTVQKIGEFINKKAV